MQCETDIPSMTSRTLLEELLIFRMLKRCRPESRLVGVFFRINLQKVIDACICCCIEDSAINTILEAAALNNNLINQASVIVVVVVIVVLVVVAISSSSSSINFITTSQHHHPSSHHGMHYINNFNRITCMRRCCGGADCPV